MEPEELQDKAMPSRIAFGEKLVTEARKKCSTLEEEVQATILFAGSFELGQRMRPHLFTDFKRATEDLQRLEKHLARLKSSH